MSDVAEIAKGLTEAQRRVLTWHRPRYGSIDHGWPGSALRDQHSFHLCGRPLMDARLISWTSDPRSSSTVITPLGLAVREHLQSPKGQGLNTSTENKP